MERFGKRPRAIHCLYRSQTKTRTALYDPMSHTESFLILPFYRNLGRKLIAIRSKEGRSKRVSQRESAIDSAKAREIRLNQFSPDTKAVPTFVEEMSASPYLSSHHPGTFPFSHSA
ncbi:hypothetical protein TNIN_493781 [Trichonephila inaurata madagascariensis]|uniref:Uncharacterized protein n=1 Tax=Trichonephila inaurata madagascariensis TaxID=2747483 RepID=A0A8X6WYW5_9ARAC|nr:hypothetical protein TNIN_493781 [Trichonephila inaurata madagascariensis]